MGLHKDTLALQLFNEHVAVMERGGFVRTMRSGTTGFNLRIEADANGAGSGSAYVVGPTEDEINAVALKWRFFWGNNEVSNLRRMRSVYQRLPIAQDLSDLYEDAFGSYEHFMSTPVGILFNDEALTNETVVRTFLFGALAHTNNPKTRRQYLLWRETPYADHLLRNQFNSTMYGLVEFLIQVRDLNVQVLNALQAPA